MHLDENLIFWDKKSDEILDCCEFLLFFGIFVLKIFIFVNIEIRFVDNIDAALILNLTCGISLNFIIDYDSFPYTPDIINPSIDYNDIDKIGALKVINFASIFIASSSVCPVFIQKCETIENFV